jgi:hypothetical protein
MRNETRHLLTIQGPRGRMQDRRGWHEGGDSGEPQESLREQPRRDQQEVQADTEQALCLDPGGL